MQALRCFPASFGSNKISWRDCNCKRVASPATSAARPQQWPLLLQAVGSRCSSYSSHQKHTDRLIARSTTPDATGAEAGQLSAALMEAMQQKISEALEAQSVSVTDVYGDGRHVNIAVVSSAFEGKNSVQRQRMVYKVC